MSRPLGQKCLIMDGSPSKISPSTLRLSPPLSYRHVLTVGGTGVTAPYSPKPEKVGVMEFNQD
jgi:hypothetical protein